MSKIERPTFRVFAALKVAGGWDTRELCQLIANSHAQALYLAADDYRDQLKPGERFAALRDGDHIDKILIDDNPDQPYNPKPPSGQMDDPTLDAYRNMQEALARAISHADHNAIDAELTALVELARLVAIEMHAVRQAYIRHEGRRR